MTPNHFLFVMLEGGGTVKEEQREAPEYFSSLSGLSAAQTLQLLVCRSVVTCTDDTHHIEISTRIVTVLPSQPTCPQLP